MVKSAEGFVLTKKSMVWPALALVAETKPSIQGHLYLVRGSIRVFSRSQDRVPGSWFSLRTGFELCARREPVPVEAQPAKAAPVLASKARFRRSRRLILASDFLELRIPLKTLQGSRQTEQGKIGWDTYPPREGGYVIFPSC